MWHCKHGSDLFLGDPHRRLLLGWPGHRPAGSGEAAADLHGGPAEGEPPQATGAPGAQGQTQWVQFHSSGVRFGGFPWPFFLFVVNLPFDSRVAKHPRSGGAVLLIGFPKK